MSSPYQLVSVYLNEADQWEQRPRHLEILQFLHRAGCSGGTVLRGLAGFTAGAGVVATSLADMDGKLPVVVEFIEGPGKVAEIMPTLCRMAGQRLITVQDVRVVHPPESAAA